MRNIEKLLRWLEYYEKNDYLYGNLLVIDNGKIIIEKSYGYANIEFDIKNSIDTKFQMGSLTKAFTAMLILILHDERKLNINDTINIYLHDFPNGDKITIYHCLTCTTGIQDFTSLHNFWGETMRLHWTLDDMINMFKKYDVKFTPGKQFSYSSSDYLLLTKIIEVVTDMSYSDALHTYIFDPLSLMESGCNDGVKVIKKLAKGYSYWGEEVNTPQTDMSFPLGAYGIYSTTRDLLSWDTALRESKLIPSELTKLMFTPYKATYGCGWDITTIMGNRCHQHFGDVGGFVSSIKRFQSENFTVIFLSNLNIIPVTTITTEIAKIRFGDSWDVVPAKKIKQDNLKLNQFTGVYLIESDDSPIFEIVLENESLFLIVPKMYEVLYRVKMTQVEAKDQHVKFITEKIAESIIFMNQQGEKLYRKIIYTDFLGDQYIVKKK